MKTVTVLVALMLMFVSSCREEEVIPKRSEEELIELALVKVAENQTILQDVFVETSGKVTRTAIQDALKTSSTKAAFISNMNALVEETFEVAVKSNSELHASDMFIKLEGIKGESVRQTITQFVLDPTAEDPLLSYSNSVKSQIESAKVAGRGLLVLIQKIADEETSEAAPSEQVSLNFDKITFMHELENRVIMSGVDVVSSQTDSEIEGILAKEGVPPIAIGLLLPAVQKVADCCTSQTSALPYWDWLFSSVNPEINGGLNRDILRRYNAAGFMGALQFLLTDEYNNENQDLASLQLLRARYEASLMFIFNDIWEKSKLAEVMQVRVKANEALLQSSFEETAKLITRKAILDARAASINKLDFIASMNELVEGVFDAEVQKNSEAYAGGVRVAVGDVDGDGTSSHLAELVVQGETQALSNYATLIQSVIDKRSSEQGNTQGDLNHLFTIVNRVTQNGTEKNSYMSVNTSTMSNAKKIKDAILAGRTAGTDPEKTIEDLRVANNIPKPLMALLLPAIQKVRAYEGTTETADTAYLQWLHSLSPMTKNGIDHDAITRYDAAGYLGAMHFFVSDKYRGDNEDYASLLLLKARYQASMVMIFSDLWGQ
ncbi:MAG TPA: hypothetical protein VGD40_16805 [Chryseosolibacter sp.]